MKKAKYIVFEGSEGVGKTTQIRQVVDFLRKSGFKVLVNKEPGSEHNDVTLELRKLILDKKYENQINPKGREFLLQTVRNITLETVVLPALEEYDYIIQDRGILSGITYGLENKLSFDFISSLVYLATPMILKKENSLDIYDLTIYLKGDVKKGLERAQNKNEFKDGDIMESKGLGFIQNVADKYEQYLHLFNTKTILVEGKSIEQVTNEILKLL
jgi:dTMP kinase